MNKIKNFKGTLLAMYSRFPELYDHLEDESYIKFLYAHMNEVDLIISQENLKGDYIINTKLKVNSNYINNITLIYKKYLSEMEINIINSGEFYIGIIDKEYPKLEEGALVKDADKFFEMKNRRDFLVPMFFHKLTIERFSNFLIDNIDTYKNKINKFFKVLILIRKYVRTIERLGVMLNNSISLSIHNIRKNNDIDMTILHPRINDKKIRDNMKQIISQPYIDVNIPGFKNVKTKEYWDKKSKILTDGKFNTFNDIIFNPLNHLYFFGIKIISFEFDLKHRATRRLPKNVADLIITKETLKINVPKIKRLEPMIKVKDKMYNTDKFIEVVTKHLKRFNHSIENVKERIEDLY
tara:strand:+ start:137 stop:1192 length:1056 start_codon:yes stop_codon:yes gene_type:complete